ncbi:MAG: TonB family protein [Zoogloea sp.]|uniref:TonB family protein n=1 Tax=Zoogloea sp. TaxID=49181 RepID=UPI003F2FA2DB
MDAIYQHRQQISSAASALVLALVASPLLKYLPPVKEKPQEVSFTVALQAVAEAPQPRPLQPTPPLPTPATPQARPHTASAPARPVSEAPATETASPASQSASHAEHSSPAPAQPSAAPAPPAAPARPAVSEEDNYLGRINAYVQSRKKYPTSREASLLRPTGAVKVWLILSRDGSLQEAGVERSSGSMILDGEALKLIRLGVYPPFPEGSFQGNARHRFFIELQYSLKND